MAEERRCEICGRPLITEKETCLSCRESDISGEKHCNDHIIKMRALFPYTGKFKTALGSYKFGKALGPGYFFAQCLNSALADFDFSLFQVAAWVPVPPRPGKIKAQGWDQIEYLARLLERTRKLPVCRCLKRLPSRSQKELNREDRASNLKGRIFCTKRPPETAVIFDDVVTTGATLNACADALCKKGCAKIYAICLFYD